MILTLNNLTQPIEAWAAEYGIPCALIRSRLKRGWSDERAITEPMVVWRGEKLPDDWTQDRQPEAKPEPVSAVPPLPPQRAASTSRRRRSYRKAKLIEHNGVSMTIRQWAEWLGLTVQCVHHRLKTKPIEEALAPSKRKTAWD